MMKKILFAGIASIAGFSVLLTLVPNGESAKAPSLVGTYRCWQFNVSGGGGSCRLAPPLVLKKNGQYTMSSEKGTYKVSGAMLKLSKSKIRGNGTISSDKRTIRFEYDYKGLHQTVTYLRSGAQAPDKKESGKAVKSVPAFVEVDITVEFSRSDGGIAWINTIHLVPEGTTPDNAPVRYDGLAIVEGNQRVMASFFGAKEVKTGQVYDVYTNSGFEKLFAGKLDLTTPSGKIVKKFTYQLSEKGTPPPPPPTTGSYTPPTTGGSGGVPCNPNIPSYSQPGCTPQ